jgi:hypothetical protein
VESCPGYTEIMYNYRLYIDESGHHRYRDLDTIPDRYLGLTGVIVRQDVYEGVLVPSIEGLRKPFYTDYDLRPAMHLTDIMSSKNSFSALTNPDVKQRFDEDFIGLVENTDYRIVTVVIDKNKHSDRYVTPEHPYHYVLECMLERYVKFLKMSNAKGDVMVEARGKKEDHLIRGVYENFYSQGTQYVQSSDVQIRLTSGKLKLKTKLHLIQGLEFADLIALSSKIDVLHTYGVIETLEANFTGTVIQAMQPKYYTGVMGAKGNGKKFL